MFRMPNRGFTLIELLVVIALLLFLAAVIVFAFGGITQKNKQFATLAAIRVVENGLDRYKDEIPTRSQAGVIKGRGYPKKTELPDGGGMPFTAMVDGEWLRAILAPTETEINTYLKQFGIKRPMLKPEEYKSAVNEKIVSIQNRNNIPAQTCFVDAWDNTIFYRFPGEDHSAESNYKSQKGENYRNGGKPDVWSAGEDQVNWYDIANKPTWSSKVNDPSKTGQAGFSDDIPGWFQVDR